jgi:hypothetical protein
VAGNVAVATANVGAAASGQGNQVTGSLADSAKQQAQAVLDGAASATASVDAQQDAMQAAHTAARGIARATWYSFAALLVGAIIAVVSGSAGFRHQPPFEEGGGSARDDAVVTDGLGRRRVS